MKWKKLGRIFCPNNNFDWMVSYAAVPFAEHLYKDIFRIYFSCRDINNRSSIAYIEIDINNPNDILKLSNEPLLVPGPKGAFDDSGVMIACIIKIGRKRLLYYLGWFLGVTVPFRNSIGLAIAENNNLKFKKYSIVPILDHSETDPYSLSYVWVIKDVKLKMWYGSNLRWGNESEEKDYGMEYVIKYAESKNGINWVRNGKVCIDFKSTDEYAISRPTVIKEEIIYKMWYSYRGKKYRIGYADSKDGINWIRKDEEVGIDVSKQGWDSEMIEYPHVIDHKGKRYMLYNGNDYGKTGFGLAVLENN